MPLKKVLSALSPDGYGLSHTTMLLPVIGAFLSIFLVALISQQLIVGTGYPILVGSMGASAVLLFVVPSSPMAKPWPFIGGHLVSALIGVASFQLLPDLMLAAAAAVSLSILAMIYLGCLHPPGGAASLAFILGGPEVHAMGFQYVLLPVAINVALMLVISQVFNNVRFSFKSRPRVQLTPSVVFSQKSNRQEKVLLTESDLDAALKDMGTFIDISHEDLNAIYLRALTYSQARNSIGKTCKEIMSPAHYTIEFGSSLEEAWHIIQDNELHGLPVVDRGMFVIGIITITDFLDHASSEERENVEEKIERLITPSRLLESAKPEVVGQIMSSQVITASLDDEISTILPIFQKDIFKQQEAHILPVVDDRKKLRGIIRVSNLE